MNKENTLTGSPLILKNTLLNLFGYLSPLIVAVFAIPLIVKAIGTDRFGILTLAWVLTGYLSLLDMGLGRALTKIVAEKLGENRVAEIPCTIWTALFALTIISVCISVIFWICSHWTVYDLLKIPKNLKIETLYSFYLLSGFIPVVVVSIAFRGVLEAYQRFDMVNAVRIPLGIFSFAAPLIVIPFSIKLYSIIAVLFVGRLIAAIVQFNFCCRVIKNLLKDFSIDLKVFRELLSFGGWMTVTNVISPLLVYIDRFFIGALLSVTAVAYYATPSEVITKLTLVSGALVSVLFPAISECYNVDRRRAAFLFERGLKYVFIVIFPIVLLINSFAYEGLRIWLNEEFASSSREVTQILAIGIFYTCIGYIPYTFIQGAGRPDLTAKLKLFEMPVYILILSYAIHLSGIIGVALVWTLRSVFDAVCMYIMAQRMLGAIKLRTINKVTGMFAATISLVAVFFAEPLGLRVAGFSIIGSIFVWIIFRYALSIEEKSFVKLFVTLKK